MVFEEYSSLIVAIATAVIGIATIYYAWQNKKMANGFKVQNKPILNLYHKSRLYFTLENIGTVSAKDIVLTPTIKLDEETGIGKLEIEELNSKEMTSIELENKLLLKLQEKKLAEKVTVQDFEEHVDPYTEEIDYETIEAQDWALSKQSISLEINFHFTYKSDSGDSYSSNRSFHVDLHLIFVHPTDEGYHNDRIGLRVMPIQGQWTD